MMVCGYLGGVEDGADAGGDAAAEQADDLKRRLLIDLCHALLVHHCVL